MDLISQSGPFATGILLSLLGISIVAWSITIAKYFQFKAFNRNFLRIIDTLRPNADLGTVYGNISKHSGSSASRIFEEGYLTLAGYLDGVKQSKSRAVDPAANPSFSYFERDVNMRLQAATESEISNLSSGLAFVATAVTLSPFLGLLGTVWGVMYTFLSIGQFGSAELSVVAPGIAEALITTIAGLAVAIPAVACNNYLASRLTKVEDDLGRLQTELSIYFNHIWQREKSKIENRVGPQRDFAR